MPEPSVSNAFLSTLVELRGGETLNDLHAAINQLVGDVRSVAKAGTISLTLKVSLAKGSTATLVIVDDIKIVAPKIDHEVTIMFADDANRLSRRDPRQPQLAGLRDAGDVRAFTRPIDASGGNQK